MSDVNTNIDETSKPNAAKKILRVANDPIKIVSTRMAAGCRYVIDKPARGSTVFRIKDTLHANPAKSKYGIPVFRIDKPGGNVKYSHININTKNPKLVGYVKNLKDPHLEISSTTVMVGEKIARAQHVMQRANKILLPLAIAIDTVRIGVAIHEDIKENGGLSKPKETIKTAGSVAGGWGGGFAGAWAGGQGGMVVGSSIGAFFGGVGAIPGAAIGGIVGSLVGGIAAGIGGSVVGERLGNAINEVAFEEEAIENDEIDEDVNETEDNDNFYEVSIFLSQQNLHEKFEEDIEIVIDRPRFMTL